MLKSVRGWIEVQDELYIPIRTILGPPAGWVVKDCPGGSKAGRPHGYTHIGGMPTNSLKGSATNPYRVRVMSWIIHGVI